MLRKIRNSAAEFIQKQINQYWYSQSIGTIFRHRLKSELDRNRFRINEALEILDKVSIDQEIDNKLPYFYKQLFIRKQYYLSELWTGRERELNEAEKAVRRYRSGIMGGILVVGDHFSGKTFFFTSVHQQVLPPRRKYFHLNTALCRLYRYKSFQKNRLKALLRCRGGRITKCLIHCRPTA